MIDDISCVIIEMSAVEPGIPKTTIETPERELYRYKSIILDKESFNNPANGVSRKDPTRGSVVDFLNEYAMIQI